MKIENYTVKKFDIAAPVNTPGGRWETPIRPGDFQLSLKDGNIPICASLLCPCNCGKEITINLQGASYQPEGASWRLESDINDLLPTVSPSIFMFGWPCQSHFFLRAGKIQWC